MVGSSDGDSDRGVDRSASSCHQPQPLLLPLFTVSTELVLRII